ncbi:MAG: hypothetical protein RL095_538 [Verrucomicrobiota bacterium]|jgi:phospholipid/cholesterol/gamma-HCH transport system substrate-binding protein
MSITENRRKLLQMEFLVGLFFIGALFILGIFTILLKPETLWKNTVEIPVEFERIGSLKVGDNVRINGVSVGRVLELKNSDDYSKVTVVLGIQDAAPPLREDYRIQVTSSSVLGGQFVNIKIGSSTRKLLAKDSKLIGHPPLDILEDASELVKALKEDEAHIRKLFLEDKIGERIANITKDFENFAANAKAIGQHVQSGNGTVGKLLMKEEGYDKIKETLGSVGDAGTKIGNAADEARRLAGELDKLLADAKSGKGTLGKLLKDEALYEEARQAAASLRTFAERLANNDGSLNKILTDKGELYAELQKTFSNFREITDKINSGEGTLAKLVNDPGLYDQAKTLMSNANATVKEVNDAVRDFREQSPVATFGGVVFGAL